MLIKRENYPGEPINVNDYKLREDKQQRRLQNHIQSERAKSQGAKSLPVEAFAIGQLVHIKIEGSRHVVRDRYILTSIDQGKQEAMVQKFGQNQFRSKKYKVKLQDIYHSTVPVKNQIRDNNSNSDDDMELLRAHNPETVHDPTPVILDIPLRRSERITRKPEYLSTSTIDRIGS